MRHEIKLSDGQLALVLDGLEVLADFIAERVECLYDAGQVEVAQTMDCDLDDIEDVYRSILRQQYAGCHLRPGS